MKFSLKKLVYSVLSVFVLIQAILPVNKLVVFADNKKNLTVDGEKFEFDENSHYEISSASKSKTTSGQNQGQLLLDGELTSMVNNNGVAVFGVSDGVVSFTYKFGSFTKENSDEKWHIIADKTKEIDGSKLSSSIGKAAILIQTSQDGETWVDDKSLTNVINEKYIVESFYKTKNIQLVSGCFYRIIVAYEMGRKIGEKKIWFITSDIYENKKYAEVFEFYLSDIQSSDKVSDSTSFMNLGSKVRTEKNDGYYGQKPIDIKDPHYGWDLGVFSVNGYTDSTEDKNGNPVFLKNVGDQITLWFELAQDIDKLNENEKLSISDDESGYDRDFEIKKTDFGRGALIIRKTDYQNKVGLPEIYTNYLEANATTNANTVVGLFEEGDYEVALDYEIKNTPRQVAGIDVIPEYSDYTIRFKFSIRNSNCMVFPFDVVTGEELTDKAITVNGFKLDLAKSRYLAVNVQKSTVSKATGSNGYVLDERFNRAAKDGESYTEEGVYVFTVSNQYTNEKTTKTVYVGDSLIIKALTKSGMSLTEINDVLNNGGKIDKDGNVIPKN